MQMWLISLALAGMQEPAFKRSSTTSLLVGWRLLRRLLQSNQIATSQRLTTDQSELLASLYEFPIQSLHPTTGNEVLESMGLGNRPGEDDVRQVSLGFGTSKVLQ